MENFMASFGKFCLLVLLMLYGIFAWGLVCYKLYHWFVIPVFVTLPTITYYQAVGLMFFITLFKSTSAPLKDEYYDKITMYVTQVIMPFLFLLIAWIFS